MTTTVPVAHKIMLSLKESSDLSGLPTGALRDLIAQGMLRAKVMPGGKKFWILRRDLDTCLDALEDYAPGGAA